MKQLSYVISWVGMGLMLICLISGVVLMYVYYPYDAYKSIVALNRVPYGLFFRELHYFSGEIFLFGIFLHVIVEFIRNSKNNLSYQAWIWGVLSFIVSIALMFTGYVLKGDLNGLSAGQIAFALISNTPILDKFLPLFKDSEFLWRFFIAHIIVFPVILLYGLKIHAKHILTKYTLVSLVLTLLVMIFFDQPKDLDPAEISQNVTGPWFFLGGENLLIKGIEPYMVVFILSLFFIIIFLIRFFDNKKPIFLLYFLLLVWLALYVFISLI